MRQRKWLAKIWPFSEIYRLQNEVVGLKINRAMLREELDGYDLEWEHKMIIRQMLGLSFAMMKKPSAQSVITGIECP